MADRLSRRELLKKAGLGGAVFLGGSVLGHSIEHQARAAATEYTNPGTVGHSTMHEAGAPALYGQVTDPPSRLGADALDHHTFPPPGR